MSEDIRTEDQVQAERVALASAVYSIDPDIDTRMVELIQLCADEGVAMQLASAIHARTHKIVGTSGKMAVPIVFERQRGRNVTFVDESHMEENRRCWDAKMDDKKAEQAAATKNMSDGRFMLPSKEGRSME